MPLISDHVDAGRLYEISAGGDSGQWQLSVVVCCDVWLEIIEGTSLLLFLWCPLYMSEYMLDVATIIVRSSIRPTCCFYYSKQ